MNIRVNMTMDERLVAKVDKYADAMCMSRSALIAFFCSQGCYGLDKSIEVLKEAVNVSDDFSGQISVQDILEGTGKEIKDKSKKKNRKAQA